MNIFKRLFSKSKPKTMAKATEPYVSVIGESIDAEKGLMLTLDWNDEFIQYLRAHGYMGVSDESIIQQWLGNLYLDMQQKIQNNYNISSDFE